MLFDFILAIKWLLCLCPFSKIQKRKYKSKRAVTGVVFSSYPSVCAYVRACLHAYVLIQMEAFSDRLAVDF